MGATKFFGTDILVKYENDRVLVEKSKIDQTTLMSSKDGFFVTQPVWSQRITYFE